jgi:hypothetical protein
MVVVRRLTRHVGVGLVAAVAAVLGLGVHPAVAGDRHQAEARFASSGATFAVAGHPAVRAPSLPVVKRLLTGGDLAVVPLSSGADMDAGTEVATGDVHVVDTTDVKQSIAARAPPVEGTSRS